VWARGRCRISPPRFLAECCKRQLNQGSFVLQYFRLSTFSDLYWVCLSVFSCSVLFVSISQVIGCEDRLRNDLYCVEWGVKLYSNQLVSTPRRAVAGLGCQCRGAGQVFWTFYSVPLFGTAWLRPSNFQFFTHFASLWSLDVGVGLLERFWAANILNRSTPERNYNHRFTAIYVLRSTCLSRLSN